MNKKNARQMICMAFIFLFNYKSLFQPQLIEISSSVLKITHASICVQLVQTVEIHIGHENHLGVGRCLSTSAIVGEGEIARREYG